MKIYHLKHKGIDILSPRENLGCFYSICYGGAYDTIFESLRKDDIVLDGGANIGVFSVLASRFVDKVYAVEPNPRNFDFLCKNIRLNRCWNVHPINAALWDQEEIVCLDGDGEISHISESGIKTHAITLGSINNGSFTVLKLDIEGAEPAVLLNSKLPKSVRCIAYEKDENAVSSLNLYRSKHGLSIFGYFELKSYLINSGFNISDYTSIINSASILKKVFSFETMKNEFRTKFYGSRELIGAYAKNGDNFLSPKPSPSLDMVYAKKNSNHDGKQYLP